MELLFAKEFDCRVTLLPARERIAQARSGAVQVQPAADELFVSRPRPWAEDRPVLRADADPTSLRKGLAARNILHWQSVLTNTMG